MIQSQKPLALDAKTTALVLIDLQHGVLARELAPYAASEIVDHAVDLVEAFRSRGSAVILVRVLLGELLSLPADSPTRDPDAPPPPPQASELVPQLRVQDNDHLVTKRQWGAFHATQLDQTLRWRSIGTIVLGGVATNFGVESTARAAFDHGYQLVFAEDAMSSVQTEAHTFAVTQIFPRMGLVRSSAEIPAALA